MQARLSKGYRNYNLDMLRAASISLVLIWHLEPFTFKSVEGSTISTAANYIRETFNFQIAMVAVPLFIMVSLYLFYSKAFDKTSYFRVRLTRILSVLIFWYIIHFLIFYVSADYFYHEVPNFPYVKTLLSGGPSLPIVGGSVLYYLFDILVLTAVGFAYCNIKNNKIRKIVGFLIIFASLSYFELHAICRLPLPYWRIDNFIIYVPTVYFLLKYSEKFMSYKYYYFMGFLLFSLQDIFLTELPRHLNFYGRISIFFGALSIFCFICSKRLSEKRYVGFLSRYSLGIFTLHKYWMLLFIIVFTKVFHKFSISEFILISSLHIYLFNLVVGIVTIVFTLVSVYLLGLTPIRRYVS